MKKILLIEDDRALRENTAELLELAGYEVRTAANGKAGLESLPQFGPDLIVCDIMMPEMDGYQVLEELASRSATRHIPFIFLSAKTEHREIRKGMDLGADDYLTKPFEENDLISAIESRLAKAELLSKIAPQQHSVQDVSEDQLRTLNELRNFFDSNGEIETYKAGTGIFEEGTHALKIYLILSGMVKCHRLDENGKDLITSLLRPNDFLGLTSFFNNVTHQESATAIEPTTLASLSKEKMKGLLENNQNISIELVALLTENIAEVKAQLLQMAYSSVRKKTAQTLLQFADLMNTQSGEPICISRNDLASVAGIAPESLIRTLSRFKQDGLIAIEGRNIRIIELEALQKVN